MTKIVLADDHEVVRAGFKLILEQTGQFTVVGEAADGNQAYAIAAREKPDVLMMDISMPPGKSGLAACEKINHDLPNIRIIITTMYAEAEYLYHALRSGARGYLLKSASPDEMIKAVQAVADGGTYVSPKMMEMLSQGLPEDLKATQQLSSRELEICRLLAKGYTNREVAEQLFISIKTVEAHRSKIYSKLGLKSRADLVSFALRHKMLDF